MTDAIVKQVEVVSKAAQEMIERIAETGKRLEGMCQEWAGFVSDHPTEIPIVMGAFPGIRPAEWTLWEMVGSGRWSRAMLSVPGYMQRKLALVPAAQVDQVTADGMDLVLLSDNGELDTLRVKLYDMSRDQFEQAFGTDGQRSEAGQRAWLEDQRTKKRTAKRARPNQYEIVKKGGRLLLKVGDVFIPRADVLMAFARAE